MLEDYKVVKADDFALIKVFNYQKVKSHKFYRNSNVTSKKSGFKTRFSHFSLKIIFIAPVGFRIKLTSKMCSVGRLC